MSSTINHEKPHGDGDSSSTEVKSAKNVLKNGGHDNEFDLDESGRQSVLRLGVCDSSAVTCQTGAEVSSLRQFESIKGVMGLLKWSARNGLLCVNPNLRKNLIILKLLSS